MFRRFCFLSLRLFHLQLFDSLFWKLYKSLRDSSIYFSGLFPDIARNLWFRKHRSFIKGETKWEDAEREWLLLKYFLQKESVFFDIGGYMGDYIYTALQYMEANNIHSFEPNPQLFYFLKKLFKNVNIHKLALSDNSGKKKFKVPVIAGKDYLSRGTLKTDYKDQGEEGKYFLDVQTSSLDQFVETHQIKKIDLIKIDKEGHEKQVIIGGVEALKKFQPVLIVEIEQRHHRKNIIEIIDLISSMNYVCYYFDMKGGGIQKLIVPPASLQSPSTQKDAKLSRRYINNFLFLPKMDKLEAKVQLINKGLSDISYDEPE